MSRTNFKELLEAGVHFGHLKKKWNPGMTPYVFMERNGIHIIDLNKTVSMLDQAKRSNETNNKIRKKYIFVYKETKLNQLFLNLKIHKHAIHYRKMARWFTDKFFYY